jgi:endonuclease-3
MTRIGGPSRISPREQARTSLILERLAEAYPDAVCALYFRSPFELLVATILSAQCTDARVNQVTPPLFERFPTAFALAQADSSEVEDLIRTTGFFRNKTKSLLGAARTIVREFGGEVPATVEGLLQLPGVARKTANVVLGNAFSVPSGVVVDTHVARVSSRLGLSRRKAPGQIELDLMKRVPKEDWISFGHRVIQHGRLICRAPRPRCSQCMLADLCPQSTKPDSK